mgnify:CR=1 FL=1|jgi:SOS-response transcriptional repressor LexA
MANSINTPDKPLTERQQQILDAIFDHWRTHSRPPSMRDLCTSTGISSTNGVYCHLLALVQKGALLPGVGSGSSRNIIPPRVAELLKEL